MTVWTELMAIPFELAHTDVNGINTRVLRAGDGEPVVFLHGVSGHLEAYTRTIPGHAEHYAVHALDMLGHGYTDKPEGPYTIDRYVNHVTEYLDSQQLESVNLVGISLGGWVAAWLASDHPDRVRRLTLIAPGGLRADPATMSRIRDSTTAGVMEADREWTRRRLEQLMASSSVVTEELVDIRYTIYHQPAFRDHLDSVLVLQDAEIRNRYLLTDERLARIAAETLVVWPVADPYGPVGDGEHLAEAIPNARLEVMPHCGHWPPFEQAQRFTELNLTFLRDGLAAARGVTPLPDRPGAPGRACSGRRRPLSGLGDQCRFARPQLGSPWTSAAPLPT